MRTRSSASVFLLIAGLLVAVAPSAHAATVLTFGDLSNALDTACVPDDTTTLGASLADTDDELRVSCDSTLDLHGFDLAVHNVVVEAGATFVLTDSTGSGTLTAVATNGPGIHGVDATDATFVVTGAANLTAIGGTGAPGRGAGPIGATGTAGASGANGTDGVALGEAGGAGGVGGVGGRGGAGAPGRAGGPGGAGVSAGTITINGTGTVTATGGTGGAGTNGGRGGVGGAGGSGGAGGVGAVGEIGMPTTGGVGGHGGPGGAGGLGGIGGTGGSGGSGGAGGAGLTGATVTLVGDGVVVATGGTGGDGGLGGAGGPAGVGGIGGLGGTGGTGGPGAPFFGPGGTGGQGGAGGFGGQGGTGGTGGGGGDGGVGVDGGSISVEDPAKVTALGGSRGGSGSGGSGAGGAGTAGRAGTFGSVGAAGSAGGTTIGIGGAGGDGGIGGSGGSGGSGGLGTEGTDGADHAEWTVGQTIDFTTAPPLDAQVGASYVIAATGGGSGNPVVFSIDPGSASVCSIVGATVFFDATGTCTVLADQAGGPGYAPAAQESQSMLVTPGSPAARVNPDIDADLVSEVAPQRGWYRTPVEVVFTCSAGSAPLVTSCPAPVVLDEDGARQRVTVSVRAADGGAATLTFSGIDIDQQAPDLEVTGVEDQRTYDRMPNLGCAVRDSLSGPQGCSTRTKVTRVAGTQGRVFKVRYQASGQDRAGNAADVQDGWFRVRTPRGLVLPGAGAGWSAWS